MDALLARRAVATWLPVVAIVPILVADAALTEKGPDVTALGVLAAIVGCTPLLLRSRLPFVAMAPLLTAGIVLVLWQLEPGNTVVLIPAVALFDLASRTSRRHTVWVAFAVVPCVAVSIIPFAEDAGELLELGVRNFALCLLALAAGDVLRSRREVVERETAARLGEERLHLAREVHDVVAHALTAINVQAGVAAHLLDRDPEHAAGALRDIKAASGAALADLRATLGVLRGAGTDVPLGPAATLDDLDQLTAGLTAAGVGVTLDVGPLDGVPAPVHAAGYRIVQEALTNALRHAGASTVTVTVRASDGAVAIDVVDDGTGTSANHAGTGLGLAGMRERAAALGGTVTSGPGPQGGWHVHAQLPTAPVGAPA